MKVLMFGWEFPPFNSGGLGTACYGLAKGLNSEGIDIAFVVPRAGTPQPDFLKLIPAGMGKVTIKSVVTLLKGYMTPQEYEKTIIRVTGRTEQAISIYGQNLFEEVERYALQAAEIAAEEPHDIIHAHDWLTFKAGIAAKKASGKPLVVHVHATEADRTGGHGINRHIYEIELEGMKAADAVVAVSNYTRNKIMQNYGISPEKIFVIHNSIDIEQKQAHTEERNGKIVLYLGRVTLQKGPDYFIDAAARVLEKEPDARFIVAGSGDMEKAVMEKAAALGIAGKILFTGFLREQDTTRAYEMASLYVMPSVSEPFGITPLEAAASRTPVLISRQSGVSEVFSNCLRVDFWDTEQMANKIIAVLKHRELQEALADNSYGEVSRMSWRQAAGKCIQLYNSMQKRVRDRIS